MNNITIESHVEDIKGKVKEAVERGLEMCGMRATDYAKRECPVDTGTLRNSITYAMEHDGNAVQIGTNVEYAVYVEMGTGKYVEGGRDTPWFYEDENGNWHKTEGQPPKPYLKPALQDHADEYRRLFESAFK